MAEDQPHRHELPPLDTLAARLEYLFETIRPAPDELAEGDDLGRKYTNREITEKVNALPGDVTISAAYVGELRRGVADDPRTSHVQALARVFGVDPGYFVDDGAARRVQGQIRLLAQLRQMDVQTVALRQVLAGTGLSKASARLVEQMVTRLQEVEGQAAASTDADPAEPTPAGPAEPTPADPA